MRPRLRHLASRGLFYLPDRGLLSRRMRFAEHLTMLARRFDGTDPAPFVGHLGVTGLLDAYPGDMSGGERRRCELALALARGPRCLIADEPLNEIEPRDRPLVTESIRTLADGGAAVLVTGHQAEDLLELADEVIWIAAGTTHGLGSPAEARAHGRFRRDYLGPAFE